MDDRPAVAARLAGGGFVAAAQEADLLVERAGGDLELLDTLVARRLEGEPLAWICGSVRFCDIDVRVHPGVYVPRPHSERLARRAVERLPDRGTAVDVCCGSGAIAVVLRGHRPDARVIAVDLDQRAVDCARANGVEALGGDLFVSLPLDLVGQADVVVGGVPYVPRGSLGLLQRDTFSFESTVAYDGGEDGTDLLRRCAAGARRFLRPGGTLLLELGGDQSEPLGQALDALGYRHVEVLVDEEGDVRGLDATVPSAANIEPVLFF